MIYIFVISFIIWVDLYTKKLARKHLKVNECRKVVGKFYFCLVFNSGAAFGFLKKRQIILKILIGITIISLFLFFLVTMNKNDIILNYCLSVLLGGALGNFIDRLKYGKVTDFMYFRIKHFPIFNGADVFVLISSILLLFLVI